MIKIKRGDTVKFKWEDGLEYYGIFDGCFDDGRVSDVLVQSCFVVSTDKLELVKRGRGK
jgi:hypothetical protein